MHIKKSKMPKAWPIPRKGKGKQFVARPSHALNKGITLLYILRDILRVARTRKEVRYMTLNGMVKVNGKVRSNEDFPVQVFDVVGLDKVKKNYRLEIVERKFNLREIPVKEARSKIVKISGKKILGKGAIQMNLDDGQNFVSKNEFSVGDSVVIDFEKDDIVKILPLKKGANVEVVLGKHSGEKGSLVEIESLTKGKSYLIKLKDGEVSLPFKTILVIE